MEGKGSEITKKRSKRDKRLFYLLYNFLGIWWQELMQILINDAKNFRFVVWSPSCKNKKIKTTCMLMAQIHEISGSAILLI